MTATESIVAQHINHSDNRVLLKQQRWHPQHSQTEWGTMLDRNGNDHSIPKRDVLTAYDTDDDDSTMMMIAARSNKVSLMRQFATCFQNKNNDFRKSTRAMQHRRHRRRQILLYSVSCNNSRSCSSNKMTLLFPAIRLLVSWWWVLPAILMLESTTCTAQESFTFLVCTRSMAASDLSRDGLLSTDEYVRLVNKLSNNQWSTSKYDTLPTVLQETFTDHASSSNAIDISGSQPGNTTPAQTASLTAICIALDTAIQSAEQAPSGGDDTSPTTTSSAPTPAKVATSPSTGGTDGGASSGSLVPIDECRRHMTIADISRDDSLNSQEYVRFVSRLIPESGVGIMDEFTTIPESMQSNFFTLAKSDDVTSAAISIAGSKPNGVPTDDETVALQLTCDSTYSSYSGSSISTESPNGGDGVVTVPSTSTDSNTSSNNDGNITIYNSFIISSSKRLTADDFQDSSQNIKVLQQAYNNFVTTILSNVTAYNATTTSNSTTTNTTDSGNTTTTLPNERHRFLRERNNNDRHGLSSLLFYMTQQKNMHAGHESMKRVLLPTESLYQHSAVVYDLYDTQCPESIANANDKTCIVAYASFAVVNNFTTSTASDDDVIKEQLSLITQGAMNTTFGSTTGATTNLFQQKLIEIDPNIPYNIESSAEPVQPTDNNDMTNGGGDDSSSTSDKAGASAGAVVGSILAIIVVFGCCVGFFHYQRSKGFTIIPVYWKERFGMKKFTVPKASVAMKEKTSKKTVSFYGGGSNSKIIAASTSTIGGASIDKSNDRVGDEKDGNVKRAGGLGSLFGANGNAQQSTDDEELSVDMFSVREKAPVVKDDDAKVAPSGKNEGGGVFGKFNAGKKRNTGGKDEVGISTDVDGNNDDFINYAFDEPVELKQGQSNQNGSNDPFDVTTGPSWKVDDDPAWDGTTGWGPDNGGGNNKVGLFDDQVSEPGSADYRDGSMDDDDESDSEPIPPGGLKPAKINTGEAAKNVKQLNALVDNGNWDGVGVFDTLLNDHEESENSEKPINEDEESVSSDDGSSISPKKTDPFATDLFDDSNQNDAQAGMTPQQAKLREAYRQQVEELVRKTCPDEIDNIGPMMNQFAGREPELINTLQTMLDRSASQRALKAVHKSKAIPERENRAFATGGAEGSAVIAAASMLNSDVNNKDYDDDDGSGSYSDGSYTNEDGTGSYSGSYSRSDGQSRSRAENQEEYDEEGSYTGSRSYDDEDASQSGSRSGSGSYDDEDRSHSGSGSETGSHSDSHDEPKAARRGQSKRTDDQSNMSGSRASGTQSYVSASGSRSYYSDEGSVDGTKSYDSRSRESRSQDSRSYDSRSHSGSQSHSGSGSY